MNPIQYIKGCILATGGLLLAVMLVQWALQFAGGHPATPNGELTGNMMLAGFAADSVRGCLLAYLYPQMKNAGSSYIHAIKFGIVTSLLVATLWVIYQYALLPSLHASWLAAESTIIILQGILSGIGLHIAYKTPRN